MIDALKAKHARIPAQFFIPFTPRQRHPKSKGIDEDYELCHVRKVGKSPLQLMGDRVFYTQCLSAISDQLFSGEPNMKEAYFSVLKASQCQTQVHLSRPCTVSAFSKYSTSRYKMDCSMERRFDLELTDDPLHVTEVKFPLPHLHLTRHFDSAVAKMPDPHKRIDHVLNSISKTDWTERGDVREEFDIIADRSTLSTLATTPYGSRFGWSVRCVRVGRRAVVLSIVANSLERAHFDTEFERLQEFRTEKLCRYCSRNSKGEPFNPVTEKIDLNQGFYKLLSAKLTANGRPLRLLYAAKIGCSLGASSSLDDNGVVELRIHRGELCSPLVQWGGKFLKWYLQSRLSGAENIVVGERAHASLGQDNEERLGRLVQLPVELVQQMGKRHWDGDVCFTFLHSLLSNIQDALPLGRSDCILHVDYEQGWSSVRFVSKRRQILRIF